MVDGPGLGRDHDERQILEFFIVADQAQQVDPLHPGHVPVREDHVHGLGLENLPGLLSVAGLDHAHPGKGGKHFSNDSAHDLGIVHHQNTICPVHVSL
jgi:hypothetical protein